MTEQSDKPSVEKLLDDFEYAVLAKAQGLDPYRKRLPAARQALRERLVALAGPLEQPQWMEQPLEVVAETHARFVATAAQESEQPKSDKGNLARAFGVCDLPPALRENLYRAAISCPHEIDAQQIILMFDSRQKGHNALAQLADRLSAACEASAGSARSDKPAASSESSVSVPKERQ